MTALIGQMTFTVLHVLYKGRGEAERGVGWGRFCM